MSQSFDLGVARVIGQEIVDIEFNEEDNYIRLNFGGPLSYYIQDDGQSCCELRYMKTDDDVKSLIGGSIVSITIKDGPDIEDDGETHEQQFLEIQTTNGLATFSNHNEHNGYYGGFWVTIEER